MFFVKRRYRILIVVLFLVVPNGCDVLPVDFLPQPATPIPGIGTLVSPTSIVDLVTPTAPGFPTQPVLETQDLPENSRTSIPTSEPAATDLPTDAAEPLLPTPSPRPDPFFILQPGNPQPLINFLKPDLGCNWMGIGGQIFDLQGVPLSNFLVQVEGELMNEHVNILGLAGGTPQLGAGGYLLEIASQPVESSGMLYLQVLDLAGRVLSDKVFITTYSDCERNFILVNFSQLPADMNTRIFLPSISNE